MQLFTVKFIIAVCFLSNIGLLCKDVQCWNESRQEKGYEQNLLKNSKDLDQEIIGLPDIMRTLDTNDKPDLLNIRLDDGPKLEMHNNPEFSNINMLSDGPYTTPVNRANLHSKTKKSSLKISEKRNNRLTNNSPTKSKSILDNVNDKVLPLECGCQELPSVHKLNQEPQVKRNKKLSDTQKDIKNFKDDAFESWQNSKNYGVNDYLDTTKKVELTQNSENKKHILQNFLLPKERPDFTQKDTNEIENGNLRIPEKFTEELKEQNNILKELLLKIDNYNNVTKNTSHEANDRRVHLILDMKNIGSRSFDLELNPIFKFRDQYDQSHLNLALTDDKKWVKTDSESISEIDINANGPENILSKDALPRTVPYVPYHYSDPVVDVPSQAPVLNGYKPNKSPWHYTCNHCRQHNVTPYYTNDFYLSTTNKTNTTTTSFNDKGTDPPCYSYYKRYSKAPIYQPNSKPYPSYQILHYPYYGLQYKYV